MEASSVQEKKDAEGPDEDLGELWASMEPLGPGDEPPMKRTKYKNETNVHT